MLLNGCFLKIAYEWSTTTTTYSRRAYKEGLEHLLSPELLRNNRTLELQHHTQHLDDSQPRHAQHVNRFVEGCCVGLLVSVVVKEGQQTVEGSGECLSEFRRRDFEFLHVIDTLEQVRRDLLLFGIGFLGLVHILILEDKLEHTEQDISAGRR